MYTIVIVLMVIASLLMCFIVLIQESKGGGLASGFASSNQIMGVRKTTDIIEKATWTLAIVMVLLSVVAAYTVPSATANQSVMTKENATPVATLPTAAGQGATQGATQQPAQGATQQSSAPAPTQGTAPSNN